jgi:hypothetical protein
MSGPIGIRLSVTVPLAVRATVPLPDGTPGPLEGKVYQNYVLMKFNDEDAASMSLSDFKVIFYAPEFTKCLNHQYPPSSPSLLSSAQSPIFTRKSFHLVPFSFSAFFWFFLFYLFKKSFSLTATIGTNGKPAPNLVISSSTSPPSA